MEWLEDAKDDFDSFVAERNWVDTQAIIDNLWEQGFNHEAELLRRAFLRAQYESISPRKLVVTDLNEKEECTDCNGQGYWTLEVEDFFKDKICMKCDGTGLMDVPVNVQTFNSSAFSVLKSQMDVITRGLTN